MTTEQELVKKIETNLKAIDTLLTGAYLNIERLKTILVTESTQSQRLIVPPVMPTEPADINLSPQVVFKPEDYATLRCKPGIDTR